MSDAYDIITWHGKRLDRMTAQALNEMEKRLGYELTLLQGSYNRGGVSASAGTHDGGGAVDLAPAHWSDKVRVGREVGFAMWHRPALRGVWSEHVHGILVGNTHASSGALRQVTDYRNHRNGLAGHAYDSTWHPSPIRPYVYKVKPTVGLSLTALQIDFRTALAHGKNAPSTRGRIIQRRLNAHGARLLADGVIGPVTAAAWQHFEVANKIVTGRPGVPDERSLRRILSGSIYFMRK